MNSDSNANRPAEPPSSAEQLARSLEQRSGIPRNQISSTDLQSTYAGLNQIFPNNLKRPVEDAFTGLPEHAEAHPAPAWGVMVETRPHPALATVLLNFHQHCDIPLQLFHSPQNLDFIRNSHAYPLVEEGSLVLTELNISSAISRGYYNQLLLSPRFWQLMFGRNKILVFQTDALCCPDADYSLSDFLAYDYIGSRWQRQRPVGLTIDGGNGGLSLRDWPRSLECLNRFAPIHWPAGEDGYFGFHLDLMGANVATMKQASRFSTQDYFDHRSFGCHQVSRLPDDERLAFLSYCPEVADIYATLEADTNIATIGRTGSNKPKTTQRRLFPDRKSMFLSHRYQCIYFEVPRTGSNSVTQLLNQLDPESPTLAERREHGGGWAFHYLTKAAAQHPDYRLIAAHRNPYDRLWSFWKHRKRGGNPEIFRTISWKRYIDWVCEPDSVPEVKGAMRDVPICEMLDPDKVDFWLDFHRMEASWAEVCRQLSLPTCQLDRMNRSPDHGPLHMAYNASMAERVAQRFAVDFEFFGYCTQSWQKGQPLECAA